MDLDLSYLPQCAVLLFAKMWAISLYQGYYRISNSAFVDADDARVFGKTAPRSEELPEVTQAQRAWRNDLENIPIFLVLALIYVLVGASKDAAPYYFVVFTAARIAHTIAFLAHLQPWRTISYVTGIACLIGMSAAILGAA